MPDSTSTSASGPTERTRTDRPQGDGGPRRSRGGRGSGSGAPTTGARTELSSGSLAGGAPSLPRQQRSEDRSSAPRSSEPRREGRPARDARPARDSAPRDAAPAAPAAPRAPQAPAAAPAADGASFADLGVPATLVASLAERGLTSPFPIQTATLPDTLAGRDVLGRGKTGSGKTLAFALPLVARLAQSGARRTPRRPRGLVLAPTRELALQIAATIEPLAATAGLKTTVIFGGVPQGRQVTALQGGIDIVIACPGRLEDLMRQRELTLDAVEISILDEADHMADLGFLPGVRRILDATPPNGQRMLFSATLDNGVDVIVKRFLTNPLTHSVDSAESPVQAMTHHVLAVSGVDAKTDVVRHLASGTGRRVLFMRTKHQAKKLARQLTASGIPAVDLHGNLSQNARQRNLEAFSTGSAKVLVATDIAARGIHVDDVELVVHVDPPTEHKAYLHRSGRTARAGAGGDVVTVMLPEQQGDVRSLMRLAKITAQQHRITPDTVGTGIVAQLTGEVADHVEPAPFVEPAPQQQGPRRTGGGGRGASAGRSGGPSAGGARSGGRSSGGRSGGSSSGGRSGGSASAPAFYSTSTPGSGGSTAGAAAFSSGRRPPRSR